MVRVKYTKNRIKVSWFVYIDDWNHDFSSKNEKSPIFRNKFQSLVSGKDCKHNYDVKCKCLTRQKTSSHRQETWWTLQHSTGIHTNWVGQATKHRTWSWKKYCFDFVLILYSVECIRCVLNSNTLLLCTFSKMVWCILNMRDLGANIAHCVEGVRASATIIIHKHNVCLTNLSIVKFQLCVCVRVANLFRILPEFRNVERWISWFAAIYFKFKCFTYSILRKVIPKIPTWKNQIYYSR